VAELVSSTVGPQIEVVVETAKDLPPAHADANQLEMALLNLGVNARDAMRDGGTLRVSASHEKVGPGHRAKLSPGHYVRLSVADTGTGMDEKTLARAIEPFFSTKGVGKGTGLGLSMVHGLASQLGGALAITSKPGLGTNVEIWLPASSLRPDAPEEQSPEGAGANGIGSVLLVDDEEQVRAITAEMLKEMGFNVIEANSGKDALELIDQGLNPDLLVTDHLMPGMTGTDLAALYRQRRPSVPVLIVSGYAEAEGVAADLPRLTKPFRLSDLVSAIREISHRDLMKDRN
jgi:CheY-like chemotaxis protein